MRSLSFVTILGLAVACAPSRGPGPQKLQEGWEANGIVVERRGEHLLVLRADNGDSVVLQVSDDAKVTVEAKELPSIQALFEGDRVRAVWHGDRTQGQADDIEVTKPQITAARRGEARASLPNQGARAWESTMDSPGGTIGSPWYVGTWGYRQPGERVGPPNPNPVTGKLVPSDARPGF